MKINISILADALSDYVCSASCPRDMALNLSSWRILSDEMTDFDEDHIYLFSGADGLTRAAVSAGSRVSPAGACGCLAFREGISLTQAANLLQGIFEQYQRWEQQVLQAVIDERSLNEIFAILAQPLKNPLALFDSAFVLVTSAGQFPENRSDTVWSEVLSTGYFHADAYTGADVKMLHESRTPFLLQLGELQKVQTCIRENGEVIGYLGSTNLVSEFTEGQLSILYAIQQLMEATHIFKSATAYAFQKLSFLIERLLRGYHVEESAVAYFLNLQKWRADDNFQLLYFCFTESQQIQDTFWIPIADSLGHTYPGSVICPFEEGILVIRHGVTLGTRPNLGSLAPLLAQNKIICAVSDIFSPFSYLRAAYLQCRAVLSVQQAKENNGIWAFEEIFQCYIIKSLSDAASLHSLCEPSILAVYQRKNGAEFIRSLKTYLINGRSISRAAAQLFVHRNTLIYRIEQMEKELEVNFQDINEDKIFRLYLSCVLVEQTDGFTNV